MLTNSTPCTVVVGGTSGIGLEVARRFTAAGRPVVVTGRDAERARACAAELGPDAHGIAFDLAEPEQIADALADVGPVADVIVAAIERDQNSVRDYRLEQARRLTVLKLVGYTEVVHTLHSRFTDRSSVVLFGGRAKDRPYPGSTTVTAINGGVSALARTMAVELAPVRVNTIHPGIVGDSPYWAAMPDEMRRAVLSRTPTGRMTTMADIADAVEFLVGNQSVNGVDLYVDGGWMLM